MIYTTKDIDTIVQILPVVDGVVTHIYGLSKSGVLYLRGIDGWKKMTDSPTIEIEYDEEAVR